MKMTDICTREDWIAFEKKLHDTFGLNAAVFDNDGKKITDFVNWGNPLCPVIKGNPKGQRYICAVAHQNLAGQAARTKRPVIGECDAGLVKIAVPVYVEDEFIGVAGGCGSMQDNSEVEYFFIHQTTGIDEDEIKNLAQKINTMSKDKAESVAAFIQTHVDALMKALKNKG